MVNRKYNWKSFEKIIVEQRDRLINAKFEDDKSWCPEENWNSQLEELASNFYKALKDPYEKRWGLAQAYLLSLPQIKFPYEADSDTETPEMRLYDAVVGANYYCLIKEIDENRHLQGLGLDGEIWLLKDCTEDEKGRSVDCPFTIHVEADLSRKNFYSLIIAEEVKKRHKGIRLDEKKVFEMELVFVVDNLKYLSQLDRLIAASLDFTRSYALLEIQAIIGEYRKRKKLTKDKIKQIFENSPEDH